MSRSKHRPIGWVHFAICAVVLLGIAIIAAAITVVLIITLNRNKPEIIADSSTTVTPQTTTTTTIDPFNDAYSDDIYERLLRQDVDQQANISRQLIAEFSPTAIRTNLRWISSTVHVAGTREQATVIDRLANQYRSYGYEVKLHNYRVLLSYPNYSQPNTIELINASNQVTLISSGLGEMLGNAEARAQQSDARARVWWNAYATGGSVTKPIVYANYGRLSDFDQLATNRINVTDRIVLMRYSRVFRADMVAEASRRGAVGAILFSDPIDYSPSGRTFPDDMWLPASGAQRGSLKTGAGDPQTPMYPSADYAYRVDEAQLKTSGAIPRIPVMPIGYRDAIGILGAMDGPVVPIDSWQGGMNVKYRWNSGDSVRFRLNVSCANEQRTITNVLAYMRGRDEPDRTILFSNHFDAWVYGALDPNSGTATMLEVARVLASVSNRTGWRPRRTIAFGQWDAEEFGLIGSSEFAEELLKPLQMNLVALLNVDDIYGNMSLSVDGVPLLYRAMVDASRRVASPNAVEQSAGRRTVFDSWRYYDADGPIKGDASIPRFDFPGSGSDFNRFLHYIGAPVVDFRFKCAPIDCHGLYHSMYEIPWTVEHILNPTFGTYTAVGQLWLELGRNLADSLVIPFNVSDYAAVFPGYLIDLNQHLTIIGFNTQVDNYQSMLSNLSDAVGRFQQSANTLQTHVDRANSGTATVKFRQMQMLNDRLIDVERCFIDAGGIYREQMSDRHVVYAPSIINEYAGATLSGIRDPAENWRRCRISGDGGCAEYWRNTAVLGFTKLQYAIESAIHILDLQGF